MRVRLDAFSLDGFEGSDLHGKTIDIVVTGRFEALVTKAFKHWFECEVIAMDIWKIPILKRWKFCMLTSRIFSKILMLSVCNAL